MIFHAVGDRAAARHLGVLDDGVEDFAQRHVGERLGDSDEDGFKVRLDKGVNQGLSCGWQDFHTNCGRGDTGAGIVVADGHGKPARTA